VPRWLWRGSESHHMQDFDDTLALPWFVFDSTMAGIATPPGAYPFPCWGLACKLRLSGLREPRYPDTRTSAVIDSLILLHTLIIAYSCLAWSFHEPT